MKKIAQTILFLTLVSACTYGQDQKTIAKFVISDARLNKFDRTEFYLSAGAYIVFYFDKDSIPCMAISFWLEVRSRNILFRRNNDECGCQYGSV